MPNIPRDHIHLRAHGEAIDYRPPKSIGKTQYTAPADRRSHGQRLREELSQAWYENDRRWKAMEKQPPFAPGGIQVEVEGFPELHQVLGSFQSERGLVEVMKAGLQGGVYKVLIFLSERGVELFLKKFEDYVNSLGGEKNPANMDLVDRIRSIKLATLQAFWGDEESEYPEAGVPTWWEVWLRESEPRLMQRLKIVAAMAGFTLGKGFLRFQDRYVLLVHATREQLAWSIQVLCAICELRAVRNDPETYLSMSPADQGELAARCVERTKPAPGSAPVVCLLDTGVQHVHPMLKHSIDEADLHTYDVRWGTHDSHGHGTTMAGLALYGDLQTQIGDGRTINLSHRLESVKVIPSGRDPRTQKELFGEVLAKAVVMAEGRVPNRRRVFNHSISCPVRKTLGGPTSYSAAMDCLAFGADVLGNGDEGRRRLFIISTGNRLPPIGAIDPLIGSHHDHLHDPAQAWNALTVGGTTNLSAFNPEGFEGCSLMIPPGSFSPTSTTSFMWNRDWALKPDVVMEAGNALIAPDGKLVDVHLSSLSLLTTGIKQPLSYTSMSSAAAAQVSELSAAIWAKYPDLWPESVRGLIVHSAAWTPQMLNLHPPKKNRDEGQSLLRCFGFGIPDRERALHSFDNGLTILIEDEVLPFEGDSYKHMNLHRMPWPDRELESIHDKTVRLKITLSYFVEPNPAERGWGYKHRYGSFGLRFDMQTRDEEEDIFRERMNIAEREDDDEENLDLSTNLAVKTEKQTYKSDSEQWLFGPKTRTRGSIHSDIWEGSAADLAGKKLIGVAPTVGWWLERHQLKKCTSPTRYSLLISLEAVSEEVNLYEPIANAITVSTPTTVSTVLAE